MTRNKWNWMIAWSVSVAFTLIAPRANAQQQVDVVNGKAHPVPVLDATQPYEDSCQLSFSGSAGGFCYFKQLPPRKRLVIQEFDSYLYLEQGLQPTSLSLASSDSVAHYFTSTFMGSADAGTFVTFATHQETRLSVPPLAQPYCLYWISDVSNRSGAYCDISGFLVDVP